MNYLIEFIGRDPKNIKVAFITTAADLYTDKWFVDKDRDAFIRRGFKVTDVDIKHKNERELFDMLSKYDLVVVAGGYVFYMLEKSLESGFDKVLNKLLAKGTVYVGGSAGAVLVGPSLLPVESLDDPSKAPLLKSFDGLGLVNFVVIPHSGEEKYKERYDKILEKFKHFKYKIIPITNKQAVEVVGDNYRIVG